MVFRNDRNVSLDANRDVAFPKEMTLLTTRTMTMANFVDRHAGDEGGSLEQSGANTTQMSA